MGRVVRGTGSVECPQLYQVNQNANMKRAFTLVELLVVVTIIGILSAIVLASLNTARTKGECRGGDAEACAKLDSEDREEIQKPRN